MESKNVAPNETQVEVKPYVYFEGALISKVHHFYISEAVGDPKNYIDMIHTIRTVAPTDTVYIYLNTPGGRIDTGVQILGAIKNCPGHVVTVLDGEVCSLGTLLFLSGDEFIINDNSLFMIHNFSGGVMGKGHEQAAQLEATIKWFTALAKEVYLPFLTEAELDSVIEGKDLWMGSNEVRSRLTKMVKLLKKEEKDRIKAQG